MLFNTPEELDEKKQKAAIRNDRYAESVWLSKENDVKDSTKYTIQFGLAALRGPVLVNGASIAALLGFLSANAKNLSGNEDAVLECLFFFVFGFLVSSISSASAYFAQRFFTYSQNSYEKTIHHPYIKLLKNSYGIKGDGMEILTMILVFMGYLSFVIGVYIFSDLLRVIIP